MVRDDFALRARQLEALKRYAEGAGTQLSLPRPNAGELSRMISNPAELVGLKFDGDVVEDLVKELSGELTPLPLLQFTLTKLWTERDRDRVTWEVYIKVGRPREALQRTADDIYEKLSAQEQATAEKLFRALVVPSARERPFFRRMRRDSLLQLGARDSIGNVLESFVHAGLIRMTPGVKADDDRFEVAHDALIRLWPRAAHWLQQEQDKSKKKTQLDETASLWQESGYEPGYLLTGDALKEAEAFAADEESSPQLRELVAASIQYRGWIWVYRGTLIFIFLCVAVFGACQAWNFYWERQWSQQLQEGVGEAVKEESGFVWIGSDKESNLLSLESSDVVLPSDVQPGTRYKLTKNLVLRAGPPSSLDYVLAAGLGIIPEQTLITVTDKPTLYNRPAEISAKAGMSGIAYWASIRVEKFQQPVVYVFFTTAPMPDIEHFTTKLQDGNYRIPATHGIEETNEAKGLNEVRYYHLQDKDTAEKLVKDVRNALRTLGYRLASETKLVNWVDKRTPDDHPGVLNVYLDLPASR